MLISEIGHPPGDSGYTATTVAQQHFYWGLGFDSPQLGPTGDAPGAELMRLVSGDRREWINPGERAGEHVTPWSL